MLMKKRSLFLLLCSAIVSLILSLLFLYAHLNNGKYVQRYHILRESQDLLDKTSTDDHIVTTNTTSLVVNRALPSRCSPSNSRSFILALNYWEQTNMAMHNLYSLVRLAAAWNHRVVVRPFTMNSRLYGLPHLQANDHWVTINNSMSPLSLLFDVDHLDELSCIDGVKHFCGFEEFLSASNRDVVLLHFIFPKEAHEPQVIHQASDLFRQKLIKDGAFECSEYLQPIKEAISNALKMSSTPDRFIVSKHYCINGSLPISVEMLSGLIDYHSDATVVILNWRGLTGAGNTPKLVRTIPAKGIRKSTRQIITDLPNYRTPLPTLYPSSTVLSFASQFAANVLLKTGSSGASSRVLVAVHIRSEKLGQREMRLKNDYVYQCLNELDKFKNNLASTVNNAEVVVFTDYGRYGSDSCRNCKGARETRRFLRDNDITPVTFDPILFNAPTDDAGFISLVEMNSLLYSDYLILVGGGSYQKQTLLQLKNPVPGNYGNVRVRDVYQICWNDVLRVDRFNPL